MMGTPSSSKAAPLRGVRVLDLSWLLPGPFCSHVLVELGAEVIKVEQPGTGDYLRSIYPAAFELLNRNKQSVAIDLKAAEGRKAFLGLAATADVVIEGFRPGVVARLGVDYDSLSAIKPGLIYASFSGYGQTGPLALRPGHDINYLAIAGALSIPGHFGEEPRRGGLPVGDLAAALYGVINIVTALRMRDLAGWGCYIDLAITDAVLHWSQVRLADYLAGGEAGWGHVHPGNDIFRTADGQRISVGLVEAKFWRNFCRAAEREDLADADAGEVNSGAGPRSVIQAILGGRDYAHWERAFLRADVPFARVNSPRQALSEPHFTVRGIVTHGERGAEVALPGGVFGSGGNQPAPEIGAQTITLLHEAGA